jgi:uncharacterized protein (TIGR01244 family)
MTRFATAISLSVAIAAGARAGEATKIEDVELGATERVHRIGEYYIASQPTGEGFTKAKALGVESVINFRAEGEQAGFDEKAVVTGLGLAYEQAGFTPDSLDATVFDDARARLRAARKPALLHCSTANRAAVVWLVYRAVDDGVPYDQALGEAKAVGLTNVGLEAKAKAYVEHHKK